MKCALVHSSLRRRAFIALQLVLVLAWLPTSATAQLGKWNARESLSGGLMVSRDQIEGLGYDGVAGLLSGYAARALLPWLQLRGGIHLGRFSSSERGAGGLGALTGGIVLRVDRDKLSPYLAFDLGVGRTGELYRPYFAPSAGLDVRVSERTAVGPVVGLGQLVQWNGAGQSSDARFLWFGLSLRQRLGRVEPLPASPPPRAPVMRSEHRETVVREVPSEPSVEVLELLERALPSVKSERVEMLAPVLFDNDSAALTPTGIAMLHEVRRTLADHPELKRVEIEAHADQRGDPEYNRSLSARRGERVRAWLVAHGVEPERLNVSARGEAEVVESGSKPADHEQNRRVIFRVIEQERRP